MRCGPAFPRAYGRRCCLLPAGARLGLGRVFPAGGRHHRGDGTACCGRALSVATNIAVAALVSAILLVPIFLLGSSGPEAALTTANDLAGAVGLWFAPTAALVDAWVHESWGALALFCAECVAVPAACIAIVARQYRAVNTAVAAGPARPKSAPPACPRPQRSPLVALAAKELRQAFSSPVTIVDQLFAAVCMVALSGAFAFLAPGLAAEGGPDAVKPEVAHFIELAVVLIVSCFASVSPASAAAVSLEGHRAWIMLTLPVLTGAILLSKLLPWCVMCATVSLTCVVLMAVGGAPCQVVGLCVFLPCASFWFTANLGLYLDVSNPRYEWASPGAVASRGRPAVVCGLVTAILTVAALATDFVLALACDWGLGRLSALFAACACLLAIGGCVLFRATPMQKAR